MDDESEATRVDANGVGEIHILDDDDVRAYSLNDFGMPYRDDNG